MDGRDAYIELMQAILNKIKQIIGLKRAVKFARNAKSVQISDNGVVLSYKGDPVKALEELVAQYEKIAGAVALMFCRQAIEPLLEKYPSIKLPEKLIKK